MADPASASALCVRFVLPFDSRRHGCAVFIVERDVSGSPIGWSQASLRSIETCTFHRLTRSRAPATVNGRRLSRTGCSRRTCHALAARDCNPRPFVALQCAKERAGLGRQCFSMSLSVSENLHAISH